MARSDPGPAGPLPRRLREALAGAGVAVETRPAVLAGYATDWTGRWSGPVLGLVRPTTTDQVLAVVGSARAAGVPVQVQGGNTGLVGGSVPDRPSLLLSTRALARIDRVDPLERTVVVGAGVTLGAVAAHARASRLAVGVDLAARDSATVGGMVATNAGGMGVLAHGMMREQVRGLVAVLADGAVVGSVGRPRKDNAGYDLPGLLVGSEGTLGVVTQVELALHDEPGPTTVGLLSVETLGAAVEVVRAAQRHGTRVLAAEVVDAQGARRAARALRLADPLEGASGWLLILEVADAASGEGLAPVGDAVVGVGTTGPDRVRLWSYREAQTEIYAREVGTGLEKLDVSARLDRLDALVAAVRDVVGDRAALGFFGHALDGNLHLQVLPQGGPGNAGSTGAGVVDDVLRVVAGLGGGISAEHGIGRAKVAHLPLVRRPDEIAWMRRVKAGVDPTGLLNPGVLLPSGP